MDMAAAAVVIHLGVAYLAVEIIIMYDVIQVFTFNIGVAVNTDKGLIVPVVRDVDRKSIKELAVELNDLVQRTRDRKTKLEEMQGGTFTITNAGAMGGGFFAPIINYPEVAILGVGEAKDRVLVKDGSFYAGKLMSLSLSCDHRVVDGAEGARFLRTLAGLLERPDAFVE